MSGSSSFDLVQNRLYLALEIFQAAVVFNHVVGESTFFFQAHLGIDMLLSFLSREAITLLESAFLNIDVASNQHDGPQPLMQFAFKQKRHFVDHDLSSGCRMLANPLFCQGADPRMDDRFEFFSGSAIIEDDRAQLLPIQGLIGLQDFDAEGFDDLAPTVVPALNDFARQSVGIDNGGAESLENVRCGGFARGNTPGETD